MARTAQREGGFMETVKTVFYALLIAGIFRTLFFQPFWIPSGSMKDTLLVGDFLFVNKMAYGYSQHSCPFSICPFLPEDRLFARQPERGDIAVFKHPVNGADFIKRLIGLPGDTIQMRDGQLILNGTPLPRERDGVFRETMEPQGPAGARPRCFNGPVGSGGVCEKRRFTETLPNGVSYATLDVSDSPLDDTPVYTVPEGHYFFIGDNRDNSNDSRVPQSARGVGYVPFENLIGRADRVIFSSAGRSIFFVWAWRGDRFFEALE